MGIIVYYVYMINRILVCKCIGINLVKFAPDCLCANIRYSNLCCRHLEHSTIIYEDPHHTPLLRLAWNKQDTNYLATVAMDACEVRMDCRFLKRKMRIQIQ